MAENEHQALENVRIRINAVHVKLLTCQNLINKIMESDEIKGKKRSGGFPSTRGLWRSMFGELLQLNWMMRSVYSSLHDTDLLDAEIKKEVIASIDQFHKNIQHPTWHEGEKVLFNLHKPTKLPSRVESQIGITINEISFCEKQANKILAELENIEQYIIKENYPHAPQKGFLGDRWDTLDRRHTNIARAIKQEVKSSLNEFKIAVNELIAAKGLMEKFMQQEDIFRREFEKYLGNKNPSIKLRQESAKKLLALRQKELHAI